MQPLRSAPLSSATTWMALPWVSCLTLHVHTDASFSLLQTWWLCTTKMYLKLAIQIDRMMQYVDDGSFVSHAVQGPFAVSVDIPVTATIAFNLSLGQHIEVIGTGNYASIIEGGNQNNVQTLTIASDEASSGQTVKLGALLSPAQHHCGLQIRIYCQHWSKDNPSQKSGAYNGGSCVTLCCCSFCAGPGHAMSCLSVQKTRVRQSSSCAQLVLQWPVLVDWQLRGVPCIAALMDATGQLCEFDVSYSTNSVYNLQTGLDTSYPTFYATAGSANFTVIVCLPSLLCFCKDTTQLSAYEGCQLGWAGQPPHAKVTQLSRAELSFRLPESYTGI